MRRAVIVGGAEIRDYPAVKKQLDENDFYVFCDSGLFHAETLGVKPGLILGDFDSHPLPDEVTAQEAQSEDLMKGGVTSGHGIWKEKAPYGKEIRHTCTADGCEMIVLPHEKDWTDTVYAAHLIAERGYKKALLIGVSGGRPDHYFANIAILNMLELQGVEAWMADEISRIRILSAERGTTARIDDSCRYFSLLAYDGPARGVRIRNALYPLEDGIITAAEPYAVSNEVLPGCTAEVSVGEGRVMLVIISKKQ